MLGEIRSRHRFPRRSTGKACALLVAAFAATVVRFDPTDDETITCIAEFKGNLDLGSCTQPGRTDTGSIFTYDRDLHEWKEVLQVNEQGIIRLEAHGDTLYVPGYDANDGGWDLGNISVHDGETWAERRKVPRAVSKRPRGRFLGPARCGDAATPPGTTVTLQVRTAATREALADIPYVGPDGTAQSRLERPDSPGNAPRAGFIQYRGMLNTENPALTPYRKRLILSGTPPRRRARCSDRVGEPCG